MVHVRELGLDERLLRRLEDVGFGELWPSQAPAAPIVVAGRSLVLAVPTASGKSLVAYLALLTKALKGGKGLYLVPLRALAAEKFADLKELASGLGLRVAVSVGDLDDAEPQLGSFDIIVTTNEKADALLRHRAHWLTKISCVVADEVHLLNEADRGPTMEVLLARFRQLNPGVQIVALSATVANSKEVAAWLGAEHVASTWRPVTLREGIHYGKAVKFTDNEIHEVKSDLEDPALALAEDSVKGGGQCLVFVNTRKSTEALAEKLAKDCVRPHLDAATRAALSEAAAELKATEDATTVEARLAKCIAGGAAFHHAGLRNMQRALVERLFKEGKIKALAATPTLAAGINLPARRVVVRDLFRYDADEGGNAPISVMEYKQMAGRAGRPKYDKVGEAITIAKAAEQRAEILLNFVLADPEKVISKLGSEGALRSHILSSVAAGFVDDEKGLKEFIAATFFAHQNEMWSIETQVSNVVDFLVEHDFLVVAGDRLRATRYGKRVSELYIDPLSAVKLRQALAAAADRAEPVTDLALLHAVCATPDVRALFVRRADAWIEAEAVEHEAELLLPPPSGLDYEFFLAELKTACLLRDWADETSEDDLVKKYQVYPGDLHNKLESAEWLLHAMEEMSRAFVADARGHLDEAVRLLDRGVQQDDRAGAAVAARRHVADASRWLAAKAEEREAPLFESRAKSADSEFVTFKAKNLKGQIGAKPPRDKDAFETTREEVQSAEARLARYRDGGTALRVLQTRVRTGAKAELIPLLKFRGVGRYRARQLWKANLRGEKDLKAASVADIARVPGIGPAIAASIKKELGQDVGAPAPESPKGGQRNLGDWR